MVAFIIYMLCVLSKVSKARTIRCTAGDCHEIFTIQGSAVRRKKDGKTSTLEVPAEGAVGEDDILLRCVVPLHESIQEVLRCNLSPVLCASQGVEISGVCKPPNARGYVHLNRLAAVLLGVEVHSGGT